VNSLVEQLPLGFKIWSIIRNAVRLFN